MVGSSSRHWSGVYRVKPIEEVSWFEPTATASLAALTRAGLPKTASLIDVGAGASPLVDDLLALGWTDLTVMDLSAEALATARGRLGERASQVTWVVGDVTRWRPERTYDVWHDRAVFHFMTTPQARAAYKAAALAALSPDGLLIVATFSPDGPVQCSGLPVARYGVGDLEREFAPDLVLIEATTKDHRTPSGKVQPFTWATFRRQ